MFDLAGMDTPSRHGLPPVADNNWSLAGYFVFFQVTPRRARVLSFDFADTPPLRRY